MKRFAQSALLLFIVFVIMISMFACSNSQTNTLDTPNSSASVLEDNDMIHSEEVSMFPSIEPATPDKYDILYSLVSKGEIDGVIFGDTLNIVYKNVSASFDEKAYIKLGVVDNNGNYHLELSKYDFSDDGLGALNFSFRDEIPVMQFEDDLFISASTSGVRFYNAKTNASFYISKQRQDPFASSFYCRTDLDPIYSGFYDGVIITTESYARTNATYVKIIYRDGTIKLTDISRSSNSADVGIYSEGLFWAFGSFYDLDENCVINLSEYDIKNVPYFVNEKSDIVIKRNGKYWETEIDKHGNFLYEPTECYWAD